MYYHGLGRTGLSTTELRSNSFFWSSFLRLAKRLVRTRDHLIKSVTLASKLASEVLFLAKLPTQ